MLNRVKNTAVIYTNVNKYLSGQLTAHSLETLFSKPCRTAFAAFVKNSIFFNIYLKMKYLKILNNILFYLRSVR